MFVNHASTSIGHQNPSCILPLFRGLFHFFLCKDYAKDIRHTRIEAGRELSHACALTHSRLLIRVLFLAEEERYREEMNKRKSYSATYDGF